MVAKRRRTRQPSANRSSSPNRPPPSGRADNLLLAALPRPTALASIVPLTSSR
jgi:hypothetical protein